MIGFEITPGNAGRPPAQPPLATFFRAGSGADVAIGAGVNGGLALWSEVGADHAACMRLDNDNAATRYSWRETLIAELRNVYPVHDMTLTGAWGQLQSSGSGLSGSYTGNRAVSTTSTTAAASVTVDRSNPYDVWVHYTARTNGGYMRVDIDGAQTLVNEIGDPASLGFKAVPTYAVSDMQRRQTVKIASDLTGTHDITVSLGGVATPGGNAIIVEAVSITGGLADPRILPPLWQPLTQYAMGDEVQMGGTFYAARANGVSGTTAPAHQNGIASDGALDWRADNRPTYPSFVAIDYASEREYALRFSHSGGVTEVGGQTHGNEVLVDRTILADGTVWTPSTTGNGLTVAREITLAETTNWQTETGKDVATCTLNRRLTAGTMWHDVTAAAIGASVALEWLYVGMLPLVHWDGETGTTVVAQVHSADATEVVLADYAGGTPANIDFPATCRVGLSGAAHGNSLSYGLDAGPLPLAGNLLSDTDAFLRPNLEARSASGNLDWTAKVYVAAAPFIDPVFEDGDILAFFSRHVLRID